MFQSTFIDQLRRNLTRKAAFKHFAFTYTIANSTGWLFLFLIFFMTEHIACYINLLFLCKARNGTLTYLQMADKNMVMNGIFYLSKLYLSIPKTLFHSLTFVVTNFSLCYCYDISTLTNHINGHFTFLISMFFLPATV